jgi:hypothetical protein
MKTAWRAVVIVLGLSVALLGCTQSGYLTVENETNAVVSIEVNGDDETLSAGEEATYDFEFPMFLIDLIQKNVESVEVAYIGWYALPDEDSIDIEAGDDETFKIEADAGVFSVINQSSTPITNIRITPSSSSSWGDNLLDGGIYTGQRFDYGPMAPVSWDIWVQNSLNIYWDIYGNVPTVNQALVFTVGSDNVIRWGDNGDTVLPLAGSGPAAKVAR